MLLRFTITNLICEKNICMMKISQALALGYSPKAMALVLKPPTSLRKAPGTSSIFLAGSIELGAASPWQTQVESALDAFPVTIWNPRRDDWDASWQQSIDHPRFREQVEWELEAQEHADLILMYFDPTTRAPVTLLELGLFVRTGKLVVCCPDGFWRKGNVEIVCRRYGALMVDDFDDLIAATRTAVPLEV